MVYTVTDADAGLRLDSFVSREGGITRSAAVRAIDEGRVTVCGALQPKKYILKSPASTNGLKNNNSKFYGDFYEKD